MPSGDDTRTFFVRANRKKSANTGRVHLRFIWQPRCSSAVQHHKGDAMKRRMTVSGGVFATLCVLAIAGSAFAGQDRASAGAPAGGGGGSAASGASAGSSGSSGSGGGSSTSSAGGSTSGGDRGGSRGDHG